jgi:hypothetical protein
MLTLLVYCLGLLAGFVISYWIPPKMTMPFNRWFLVGLLFAVSVFLIDQLLPIF